MWFLTRSPVILLWIFVCHMLFMQFVHAEDDDDDEDQNKEDDGNRTDYTLFLYIQKFVL